MGRELNVTKEDRRTGLSEHVQVTALNPPGVREPPLLMKVRQGPATARLVWVTRAWSLPCNGTRMLCRRGASGVPG